MEDKRLNLSKIIQETKEGVVFTVYVKPESMRERLRLEYGELVFYTNEPAEKGRANASLVRFTIKLAPSLASCRLREGNIASKHMRTPAFAAPIERGLSFSPG